MLEESSRRRFTRYVHVKNWNLIFYCLIIAKSENAMLWRMLSRLETCIVYCCIWTVTLTKSIVPRKTWRKLWHSYISKLFLTKMQVKFSILFHHGSLNVIGDKFRFVRSKLKSPPPKPEVILTNFFAEPTVLACADYQPWIHCIWSTYIPTLPPPNVELPTTVAVLEIQSKSQH